MIKTIFSVFTLLLSFGILCLGHGLNNTLLGLRATLENYPEWITGLMMSGYFFGFIMGTSICNKLIPKVGHIRTFAAFASSASAISLVHAIFIHEITWILLRIMYGICIASLYMVIESWLNASSTKNNRGRILSAYMIVSFLFIGLGQILIYLAEPKKYILFSLVSILISFALVPLTLSKIKQPQLTKETSFGFIKLIKISPFATIGCSMTGLTIGAFWGLGAVYYSKIGLSPNDVAFVIFLTYLGGLFFQWPIGYLSDYLDRRKTIIFVLILLTLISICTIFIVGNKIDGNLTYLYILSIFFGGFCHTLYSLFIAHANDFVTTEQTVKASGGLITLHALGAIMGPILAAILMEWLNNIGLFVFITIINIILVVFGIIRSKQGHIAPEETTETFVTIPNTGPTVIELDPRSDK